MKKWAKALGDFLPAIIVIVAVLVFKIASAINLSGFLDLVRHNWLVAIVFFTLGVCWGKFRSHRKTSITPTTPTYDDDDD